MDVRQTRKRTLASTRDAEVDKNDDVASQSMPEESSQRSGKWSLEEEQLANKLVSDFESGLLDDCENGTTLRSYLAWKLNCAPMRISKKFAGRCIGKVSAFYVNVMLYYVPYHLPIYGPLS
jgi:hypothetical protein